MYNNKKEQLKLFISFDTSDKTSYIKDREKIRTILEEIIPTAEQLDTKSTEEIIYLIPLPKTKNLEEKRILYLRMKSVFLQTQEFLPHFTNYAL